MKKSMVMIIKNSLTGEQVRLPSVENLSPCQRDALIEAYTDKWTEHDIGYYVSYMYEQ